MLINSNKKFMSLKKYQRIRLIIVFFLAMAVAFSITLKNFILPVILLIVATLIIMGLRRSVKEIIADERDYEVAGHASRWAITVFSSLACITTFVLCALRDLNPSYEIVASTLAYSTCFLMLVYSLIFRFYNKSFVGNGKWLYIILSIILFIVVLLGGMRLFSGEDNWVCQNGAWEKHGQPDFPAPVTECK